VGLQQAQLEKIPPIKYESLKLNLNFKKTLALNANRQNDAPNGKPLYAAFVFFGVTRVALPLYKTALTVLCGSFEQS
jgi:hypothetical protein